VFALCDSFITEIVSQCLHDLQGLLDVFRMFSLVGFLFYFFVFVSYWFGSMQYVEESASLMLVFAVTNSTFSAFLILRCLSHENYNLYSY